MGSTIPVVRSEAPEFTRAARGEHEPDARSGGARSGGSGGVRRERARMRDVVDGGFEPRFADGLTTMEQSLMPDLPLRVASKIPSPW